MSSYPRLLTGGTLVTQNKNRDVFVGDILIEKNKITKISPEITPPHNAEVVDVSGQFVIPGLIQVHTHLCQALFRGYADDLPLLDWLKNKIWPFEKNHNEKSIQASARIGLYEMQLLGTTSILDMGTVRNTDALLEEVDHSKMRYVGGKCLMDFKKFSGPLYEDTQTSLLDLERQISVWHNKTELIQYAISPRFVVSCTEDILLACADLQKKYDLLIHTHASESKDEIALVKKRTGLNNIDYLASLGLLNKNTVIVHGVHMSSSELKKMIRAKAKLVHCPSSNLKLASGIAPIHKYILAGLTVGLGSDGAPCNNTMDPFLEMRLAALLQKPVFGPEALSAQTAFDLATLGGAKVLGRENELGSLEVGKLADIVTVSRSHPSVHTVDNPYSALVYSCSGRDVKNVFINGESIVTNGTHQIYSDEEVLAPAKSELKKLLKRIDKV